MRHSAPDKETLAERAICRAFHAALLLTANTQQSESAVLEAIHAWGEDDEPGETLFRNTLRAAVRRRERNGQEPVARYDSELQAVLNLPPNPRRCFVLRFFAGLSTAACAELLQLDPGEVEQHTCTAMHRLAGLW